MDARIDVFEVLDLATGDAHVIRNAGAVATDDAMRSLILSQQALGTAHVVVMGHTDCGLRGLNSDALRERLKEAPDCRRRLASVRSTTSTRMWSPRSSGSPPILGLSSCPFGVWCTRSSRVASARSPLRTKHSRQQASRIGRRRRSSSVVEQGTHKPLVGGSNPPSATKRRRGGVSSSPLSICRCSASGTTSRTGRCRWRGTRTCRACLRFSTFLGTETPTRLVLKPATRVAVAERFLMAPWALIGYRAACSVERTDT